MVTVTVFVVDYSDNTIPKKGNMGEVCLFRKISFTIKLTFRNIEIVMQTRGIGFREGEIILGSIICNLIVPRLPCKSAVRG